MRFGEWAKRNCTVPAPVEMRSAIRPSIATGVQCPLLLPLPARVLAALLPVPLEGFGLWGFGHGPEVPGPGDPGDPRPECGIFRCSYPPEAAMLLSLSEEAASK